MKATQKQNKIAWKFGCVLLASLSIAIWHQSQSTSEYSEPDGKRSAEEFHIAHSKNQACNQWNLSPFASGIDCKVKLVSEDTTSDQKEHDHANELQRSMYASLPSKLIEDFSKGDETAAAMYVSYSFLCKLEKMHLQDGSDLCIFGKYELYDVEFKSRLGNLGNSGSEFAKMQLLKWDSMKQSLRDSPDAGQVEESPEI